MGQGNAVVHISTHNLAQVQISLPPAKEQSAIAAVLLDMNSEIAALERRRNKTRAIKQGMMHELPHRTREADSTKWHCGSLVMLNIVGKSPSGGDIAVSGAGRCGRK